MADEIKSLDALKDAVTAAPAAAEPAVPGKAAEVVAEAMAPRGFLASKGPGFPGLFYFYNQIVIVLM